ncbi:MAG: nucleotide sugar dehydrogenase, partial [Halovenus sp.]
MSSVCVHGLGYVGLPTAAMLANYGHDVFGYDANETVRAELRDAETPFDEPGLRAFLTQALESDKLEISDEVVPAKYQIICVPTPFDETEKTADLSYIKQVGRAVAPVLREGDTVILESTVPPGTTVEELQPLLEESGLVAGEDFALAHSPETVLPGNIITELRENNRIVGGVNAVSAESAVRLYDSFVNGRIRKTCDPTVAEFVKLIQNTSRDTNIALANEIARLAHDYGIDSRETIELANEHPRVDILQPGPVDAGPLGRNIPWFSGPPRNDALFTPPPR